MDRKTVVKRFNRLPKEHRVTIIAYETETEILRLEREKKAAIEAHKKNMKRINESIRAAEKNLEEL